MPAPPHHLLLTGMPGIGKTTVIRHVAEALPRECLRGFYTEEIREGGVRQGFRLCSFDAQEWLIAHIALPKRYHVGKYGVDVAAIDAATSALLTPTLARERFLVDEIGKMECLSAGFTAAMRRLLDSANSVIATVGMKGEGLIAEVKQRDDCLLWEITRDNRDAMPRQVLAWLDTVGS